MCWGPGPLLGNRDAYGAARIEARVSDIHATITRSHRPPVVAGVGRLGAAVVASIERLGAGVGRLGAAIVATVRRLGATIVAAVETTVWTLGATVRRTPIWPAIVSSGTAVTLSAIRHGVIRKPILVLIREAVALLLAIRERLVEVPAAGDHPEHEHGAQHSPTDQDFRAHHGRSPANPSET
jgi:hypothetical protein